jgi:hypothetical protein
MCKWCGVCGGLELEVVQMKREKETKSHCVNQIDVYRHSGLGGWFAM